MTIGVGGPTWIRWSIEFASARGRADLFDIPVGPARRILPEGLATWSSEPRHSGGHFGIERGSRCCCRRWRFSIDRAPIVNVLAQHKGDAAFGLLPQWLSGYAFLFQSTPDVARAKQLASQLRPGPVSFSYPANDAFLRSVAERVALNARDAGITIRPTPAGSGNLRLLEWPIESTDGVDEQKRMAGQLGAADRANRLRCRPSPRLCTSSNGRCWMNIASFRWFICARPMASRHEFTSSHRRPTRSRCIWKAPG